MSNVAVLFSEHAPKPERAEIYLGPARVTEVRGSEVRVELPGGEATRAQLALAFPYQPAPGDVLLVTGKGDDCYVIGVLDGKGRTALALQGDVEVRAVGGALQLTGDEGVRIGGKELDVRVGKLRMVAGAVLQHFTSVVQRVSALLSVHAGQTHTAVDGESVEKARTATILTEETMTINGKQIHLG